ncbi:MAG: carotenoid biosynthesis protein [Armatimonadetes bacterium]|nr:carotenoid biosynthesis protein [Armatimonadota bacterium]
MNPPSFSPKSRPVLLWGAIFLFVNGFFVAEVPQATRPELAGVSAAFVLVLWAPSAWILALWLGWKRATLVLGTLGAFAVGIESFAVVTGWPYGHFSYGEKIGTKLFGLVPWTVPFSWPPLVLGAAALAARITPKHPLIGAVAILLGFDLVLDPGAVQQEFWAYQAGGFYFGVPFSNFCGWIISGLIGVWLFSKASASRSQIPLPLVSSVTLILAFWTSVCLFTSLWIPALIGFGLLTLIWCQILGST